MYTTVYVFMPADANANWGFIRNSKHYMPDHHEMMPLTETLTMLRSPT